MNRQARTTAENLPEPPVRSEDPRTERIILLALAVLSIAGAALWLRPIGSSLWLDEAGTTWVIKDGFGAAFDRSLEFQGQSPLYYIVALIAMKIGGANEVALRIPSILAAAAGAYLLYRLGTRILDRRSGLVAAAVFVTYGSVSFAATDARPYALALLCTIAATLALVRWLDEGRPSDHAAYVILAALTIYVHYLFALMLVAHAVYALSRRSTTTVSLRRMVATPPMIALACVPLLPQFLVLWRRGPSLSWTGEPSARSLAVVLVQPLVLFGAGVAMWRLAAGRTSARGPLGPVAVMLLSWAIAAPVVTYVISAVSTVKLFDPRYFLSALPATPLLVAWAIREMRPAILSVVVAGALFVATGISTGTQHAPEPWRAAVAAANRALPSTDAPVLVNSGFIESQQIEWLTNRKKASFVLAPVTFYAAKGRAIAMPFKMSPEGDAYVDALADRELRTSDGFVMITNYVHVYAPYLEERLRSDGFRARRIAAFGTLQVTLFERAT